MLFSDGNDENVYACIAFLILAATGFAFDAVAFKALKAVRGGSYDFEKKLTRYKSFKAFSVLGIVFGIIPALAFCIFARSIENYFGESNYDITVVYATIAAVSLTAVLTITAYAARGYRRNILYRARLARVIGNRSDCRKRQTKTRSGTQREKVRARLYARKARQMTLLTVNVTDNNIYY